VGVIAARESLSLLTNLGTTAIETHNVELAKRLSAGLYDLGLPVCMPDDPGHQVHVVSLGSLDTEHDPADIDRLLRLYQHLAEHRVRASWRNGILRFSMHVYNDGSDVDRILALAKDFVTCTQP
jgi:selenocysteine lyase/cysteine desulfurase